MIKKIIIFILLSVSLPTIVNAQIGTIRDTTSLEVSSIKPPEHLIGIKYGVAFTNVMSSPDLKTTGVFAPFNVSILYTRYQPLWSTIDYFGFQVGLRYGSAGFTSLANIGGMDQTVTNIELPVLTAFNFDVGKRFRILLSLGFFGGYRLTTTRETWDCYDQRLDFGILGNLGFAIKLHPFELHIEGGYQYSLLSYYHSERQSTLYHISVQPTQINFSLSLHYHF